MTLPVLRTERLLLRPWEPAEVTRLFDIRSRRDVARWLSDPEPWADVATAAAAIEEWAAAPGPHGVWAAVPHGAAQPAGTLSLSLLPSGGDSSVGWYLHPDSIGKGYATEGAVAVLRHAAASRIERVWAIMWPQNDASAAVAAAAGMDDLGIRDDPWYGSEEEPTSRMFRLDTSGQ